jgi:hypothetical protein
MTTHDEVGARITAYLAGGGLFNPELANHDAVRGLIIECRHVLRRLRDERDEARKALEPFASCFMKPQTKYMMLHKDYDSEPLDELTADGLTFGHLRAAFLVLRTPHTQIPHPQEQTV